ncbi:uncharacterized protein ARMOST_22555 [Armillaria ostoyae]|uniref:CxC2-like cysteine cluster KDZ transposase-associated domain-containing protein n=1 Tax=Armillaria ostoyae TaxID=47428 RepID=A0A284SD72_ARMOS|nr:uncharacterized protein ARMOST_22555 [Armillaria ostoyae]
MFINISDDEPVPGVDKGKARMKTPLFELSDDEDEKGSTESMPLHETWFTKTKEGQLPVMDKDLYPSITELSSGSFLDPNYAPSAKVQGGEEEESTTHASRLLGIGLISIIASPILTNVTHQDHPLLIWSQLHSEFLDKILKLDDELVLHCPACPQPSINLPPDWNKNLAPRWLYCLFLAIDANFWLCRLNVSSDESDPSLNLRYAYFIEETTFRSYLDTFGKVIPEEEKSTCNNHDAIKLANSRDGHGAMATGNILYLVPKFHLPAHVLKCRNNFSFNFSTRVGRTNGEAPEHGWAATNTLAMSTKEMGSGAHRDTLDDHFGDYNWRKIIILADTLCNQLKEAVKAHTEHVKEFIGYDAL